MIPGWQLLWYARRLGRMSGPEVAHRLLEQFKRMTDSRRDFGWNRFSGFGGPLHGLPGFTPASPASIGARYELKNIEAGEFHLLGQRWPMPVGDCPWYAQDGVWHRDPVSGNLWPGTGTFAFQVSYRHDRRRGDVKFVWELNRLQTLQVLAAAGASDSAAEILESWMQANPPFDGINWASSIEAASRIVSLLVLLNLASTKLRRRLDAPARQFLAAHAYWIARYPSLYSSANNHRVAELASLLLASVCAPGLPESFAYLAESLRGLEQVALSLFHPDGVGAEQSPTYAAYSLEWFAIAGLAAESVGRPFSADMRSRLHAAALHLRTIMDDSGSVPRVGDDDEGRVLVSRLRREDRYVASVLAFVARWLGDRALQPPSSDPHLRDQFAVAMQSEGAQSASTPADSVDVGKGPAVPVLKVFPYGGYTIARTATQRGTLVTMFDHGPLGFGPIAAHGHADALAIWLHWGDEPILVDAGTYLYHSGGPDRDFFRGTRVHNTLELEGADQSIIAGPFNWSRHARSRIVERTDNSVTAEHDGYARRFGVIHRRRVAFEQNGLVIDDWLFGNPTKVAMRWSMGFLLGPGLVLRLDGACAAIEAASGRALTLRLANQRLSWLVTPHSYSPAFNRRDVVKYLSASGDLCPSQPRPPHILTTTITPSSVDGCDK
jgi:Heparinase II/III-like protein/Heparinase II/III N-terminus